MDQNGDVQPVGGINEKLEGFFDLCRIIGLDGNQGVIIPKRNVKNLMLKSEVIEAVKQGKFTIYAIEKVDEGLEIMTGIPVGELREDGTYPEGTVNDLVVKRLTEIAESMEKKKENYNLGLIAEILSAKVSQKRFFKKRKERVYVDVFCVYLRLLSSRRP